MTNMTRPQLTGPGLVVLVATGLLSPLAGAQSGASPSLKHYLPYLGTLEKDGRAFDGELEMTFELFDSASPSAPAWSETQQVQVVDGRFSLLMGQGDGDGVDALVRTTQAADELYLKIQVREPGGELVTMAQSRRFYPLPLALWIASSTGLQVHEHTVLNGPGIVDGQSTLRVSHDAIFALQVDGEEINVRTGTLYLNQRSEQPVTANGTLRAQTLTANALYTDKLVLHGSLKPHGTEAPEIELPGGMGWGTHWFENSCAGGHYVCGLGQQIDNNYTSDYSGLNDVRLVCCPF